MAMIKPMSERTMLSRRAGRVTRYHTQYMVKPENVAEHTFNILNLLYIMTSGKVSYRLITAALNHDQGEYISGDIPSPVKRGFDNDARRAVDALEEGAIKVIHPYFEEQMTAEEAWMLKLADQLDGVIKCTEEVQLGNRSMVPCGDNYRAYIEDVMAGRDHDHIFLLVCEILAAYQGARDK